MKTLKKLFFPLLILSLATEVFSAPNRAQAFSRANCHYPVAFNESISYDLFTGIHRQMIVTSTQQSTCGDNRENVGYNPAGFRVRAGFIDINDDKEWVVKGKHQEVLDNGTIARVATSATNCNLELDQWY